MATKKSTGARVKTEQFTGKTINKLDITVCNCVVFYFTDGTTAELEVESVIPSIGLYGIASVEPSRAPIG